MKSFTHKERVKKLSQKWEDKYTYISPDNYNSNTKIIWICKEHWEFEKTYRNHLKQYCPYCITINKPILKEWEILNKVNNDRLDKYYITNYWRVWSDMVKWKTKWHWLIKHDDTHWYDIVNLTNKDWTQQVYKVHRLVANAFLWASNLLVNHKNGNKKDNRVENLEWVTASENCKHAYRTWLRKPVKWLKGEDNPASKLSNKDRDEMLNRRKHWETSEKLAKEYWITQSHLGKLYSQHIWPLQRTKKQFTEEDILKIFEEKKSMKLENILKKYEISTGTWYGWKRKYNINYDRVINEA